MYVECALDGMSHGARAWRVPATTLYAGMLSITNRLARPGGRKLEAATRGTDHTVRAQHRCALCTLQHIRQYDDSRALDNCELERGGSSEY